MEIENTASEKTNYHLTVRSGLLMIGIALLLDLIGFWTVTARVDYSSNSAFYIEMVQKGTASVRAPFRYRALVPFVARMLPLPAAKSLAAISYVSLAGCLFLSMLICQRIGLSISASVFGTTALFCSRAFTYNYVNPYMTDAMALLAMFAMVHGYLGEDERGFRGWRLEFGIASIVGVLAHEITVFLVPAVLFSRRWKRGLAICALSAFVFLLTRFLVGSGYTGSLKKEFLFFSDHLFHPLGWLKAVVLTWYLLWPLFAMGMAMLSRMRFQILVCATLLTAGALFLSSFVLDTERTYSILAPVMVIAAATVFQNLWKDRRLAGISLWTVMLAEIASAQAYRTGTKDLRLLAICSVPAIVGVTYAFHLSRDQMRQGLIAHVTEIRRFFARTATE